MVTEVLENPLDETENNSSNDQDVQFADDISDNSNDLTVDQQMSNFYSDQNDGLFLKKMGYKKEYECDGIYLYSFCNEFIHSDSNMIDKASVACRFFHFYLDKDK